MNNQNNVMKLTEQQKSKLETYIAQLIEWNDKINLTAITDEAGVWVKHCEDSLTLLDAVNIPASGRLLDVGSGGGFPGIPLKAAREDLDVTLLDSTGKKVEFIKMAAAKSGIEVNCICARAEELARRAENRERYDVVTARAVAALPVLAEMCLPFVKTQGEFAAMKGPGGEAEAAEAVAAIEILGGELCGIKEFELSDGSKRNIIIIKKISQTPTKYPRTWARISKYPL